jgi:hypothetical protein
MKNTLLTSILFLAGASCSSGGPQSKASPTAVPAAVRTAAETLLGPGVAVHPDDGAFEAAIAAEIEVELAADGTLLATEVELPPALVPAAVARAIQTAAPGGKIDEAELIMKDGAIRFEVEVRLASGKTAEYVVSLDGVVGASDEPGDSDDEPDEDDDKDD